MAWTTPLTAVANAALTAAQWNASVRDNLAETAPAKATTAGGIFVATGSNSLAQRIPSSATVVTSQTTVSTTFTDLATTGPAVTVTTGPACIVSISCDASNSATANAAAYMGIDISGATVAGAGSDRALMVNPSSSAGAGVQATRTTMLAVTGGSNTFTSKYRVNSGTGTFLRRELVAIPL